MSYYYKQNNQETGPMEERTVIAKLIDGEINSRTYIKDHYDGDYRMLQDSDFNAILGHLTSRWRYNIGALKREFIYLMVSLAVWLIPLLTYLGGLFNDDVRSVLFHFGVMGLFGFFSFAGFFSSCYFAWVFAYRLWRVVPKSMYHITPGWRIMLTFIPIFRFGWNYCMWIPLANKLRALTNYSMKTGKVAAYFYCTNIIVLGASIYAVAVLPWSYSLLNGKVHEALWENILGWLFLGLLIVSFGMTIAGFIVMTYKMKKAALAILRHRYAYNVCVQTKNSAFLESTLKKQRHYDKVHRWGHGLGIGGVLVGWPLMFVGIPVLVLFIVGSCRYEKAKYRVKAMGFPSSLVDLYAYGNVADNALDDIRKLSKSCTEAQLNGIFAHKNLSVPSDWANAASYGVDRKDVAAINKLRKILHQKILNNVKSADRTLATAYIDKYAKLIVWLLESPVPEIFHQGELALADFLDICQKVDNIDRKELLRGISTIKSSQLGLLYVTQFVIRNLLREKSFDDAPLPFPPPDNPKYFWRHVYKKTPFMYFSKKSVCDAVRMICVNVKTNKELDPVLLHKYRNSSFMLDEGFYLKQAELLAAGMVFEKKLNDLSREFGVEK